MPDLHQTVAGWLANSKSAIAFTGAGISTESGIPDFRSPGGIWSQSKPVMYDDFVRSAESRYEYWRQKAASHRDFFDCPPNAGHQVLAAWEAAGRLQSVLTQNIDGLHEVAGSKHVIELHGSARFVDCLECSHRHDAETMVALFLSEDVPPNCVACGGVTKHATISFGQSLRPEVLQQASDAVEATDLIIAMGSSLVVEPAASIPRLAKANGAKLVIINRDPTPLDNIADVVIHAGIGDTLSTIQSHLAASEEPS
ncbi:MAG: Sir2 family NAD-dependent protein deacetylase [bacterium]|nr:Sir2 family NAD-dependent protein deacetylase [bacterium]